MQSDASGEVKDVEWAGGTPMSEKISESGEREEMGRQGRCGIDSKREIGRRDRTWRVATSGHGGGVWQMRDRGDERLGGRLLPNLFCRRTSRAEVERRGQLLRWPWTFHCRLREGSW